jgi:hypothetical protein
MGSSTSTVNSKRHGSSGNILGSLKDCWKGISVGSCSGIFSSTGPSGSNRDEVFLISKRVDIVYLHDSGTRNRMSRHGISVWGVQDQNRNIQAIWRRNIGDWVVDSHRAFRVRRQGKAQAEHSGWTIMQTGGRGKEGILINSARSRF